MTWFLNPKGHSVSSDGEWELFRDPLGATHGRVWRLTYRGKIIGRFPTKEAAVLYVEGGNHVPR